MKLCIRAHDLGVMGTEGIVSRLEELGIDGIQLVCYKAYEDIPQESGAITAEKAAAIGEALREKGVAVPLVGAYFNPVHSDPEKRRKGFEIFSDYLRHCKALVEVSVFGTKVSDISMLANNGILVHYSPKV